MKSSNQLSLFHASLLEFLLTAKQGLMTVARDYDLTSLQAITLVLIDSNNPKPMNAFQKLYSCDASNITGIVDGIEEKGLVIRSELPGDRRVKVILLTPKGAKLQKILASSFMEVDHVILKNLTKQELATFQSIIIKLSMQNLTK
ncbi:MAG: Transcriptional regulator, MarR family [Candidatus Saccharibacteria bacterium]|nr:Transcriptional regulator, MarR family [Candidatus Saccharibacteria bacterium]